MEDAYLTPWLVSNIIALILLFFCWKYPRIGRFIYGMIFLVASIVNTIVVIRDPKVYLHYGELAFLTIYESFINGFFSENILLMVLVIAFMQLLIALGILAGTVYYRPALTLAMLFSIGITPLGIGAAFPAPIFMFLALVLLYLKRRLASPKSIVT